MTEYTYKLSIIFTRKTNKTQLVVEFKVLFRHSLDLESHIACW